MYNQTKVKKLGPGEGRIILEGKGIKPSFRDIEFSYPLKLIVPLREFKDNLACIYLISYGGGLIAGDKIEIEIKILDSNSLVLLTQGSTKVFQSREGTYVTNPLSSSILTGNSIPTLQNLKVNISTKSSFYLLPSPITCFSKSKYKQIQEFHLESKESNLFLLDWFNSGRMLLKNFKFNKELEGTKGEEWNFNLFETSNEIFINNKRVVKDILRLEDITNSTTTTFNDDSITTTKTTKTKTTSYKNQVEPYSCYCTLFLFGPNLLPLIQYFNQIFNNILQYKLLNPYDLIWSFSELENGTGAIIRCAGISTERVKDWLIEVLEAGGIIDLLGRDLWSNAL